MSLKILSIKILSLAVLIAPCIHASNFKFDYQTKEIFSLEIKNNLLNEIPNSRVQSSEAIVTIGQVTSDLKDVFNVKIDREDRRKSYHSLRMKRLGGSKVELSLGQRTLVIDNMKNNSFKLDAKQASSLFERSLRLDTSYLISGIDENLMAKNVSTKLKSISFHCQDLASLMATCYMDANLVVNRVENKDSVEELKSHLKSLNEELKLSAGQSYDILSYREFLSKAEVLSKKSLNTQVSSLVESKLLKIKRLLVDERIDTYEYTAIRCVSISKFIGKLLKIL